MDSSTDGPGDTAVLTERVRALRAAGRSPKQIARALDVRLAVVAPVVRALAKESASDAPPPVVGCWANPGWSEGLGVEAGPWPEGETSELAEGGLVTVVVARRHRWDKLSVCCYLVDVYCLGVKNAVEPRIMDERELPTALVGFYGAYDAVPLAVPIELAQHLVLGAVDYARGLGFEPHPDFAEARDHLGPWTGPSVIRFGCDGKPTYRQGPYDDARKIMRTLDASVGSGNYDFTVSAG